MNNDTPRTNAVIASKDQYDSFDAWLDALEDHARALELENAEWRAVADTVSGNGTPEAMRSFISAVSDA